MQSPSSPVQRYLGKERQARKNGILTEKIPKGPKKFGQKMKRSNMNMSGKTAYPFSTT